MLTIMLFHGIKVNISFGAFACAIICTTLKIMKEFRKRLLPLITVYHTQATKKAHYMHTAAQKLPAWKVPLSLHHHKYHFRRLHHIRAAVHTALLHIPVGFFFTHIIPVHQKFLCLFDQRSLLCTSFPGL